MLGLAGVDWSSIAQSILSIPGIDPRGWVSIARVDDDTPQQRSVQFAEPDGSALPYPLVNVTLQPSGLATSARVLALTSGPGVGSWRPFVGGDEVLVLVPGGDEHHGCVVVGRLPNALDVHPKQVAGNDATQNNFAFDRYQEPYAIESGTALLLHVTNGCLLTMGADGNITLASGDGNGAAQHYLHIGQDFVGLQSQDGTTLVQLDPAAKTLLMQAGTTQFFVDSSGQSAFTTAGQLSFLTAGGGYATGHGVTVEQVLVLIEGFMTAWAAVLSPLSAPLTGNSLAATMTPPLLAALMTAGVTAAAALALTTEKAALLAALMLPPDPSGTVPGVGRPALLL
jgi:phage baseplate assembly protein gpV